MKFAIVLCCLSFALARPELGYQVPVPSSSFSASRSAAAAPVVAILRDDRVNPEAGKYSFNIETEDGLVRSESGSPTGVGENPTGQQGSVSFTFPTGEAYDLKFVANEGGYQPESSWLPVAPAFPHPIPQFVLDQIAKAVREDAEAAKSGSSGSSSAPSGTYGAPQAPSNTYSF